MEEFMYILLIVISIVILLVVGLQYCRKNKNVELKADNRVEYKDVLQLRLQAYERFVLFLERIRPQSLLVRMSGTTDSVSALQVMLLNAVREEFEHNFSQQIYLSESSWKTLCVTKDNLVRMINIAAKNAENDSISSFSEELLSLVYENDDDLIDTALTLLRNEARLLYLR